MICVICYSLFLPALAKQQQKKTICNLYLNLVRLNIGLVVLYCFFFVVLDVVADAIITLILLLLFLAFFMNLDEKRKKALRPISSLLDLTLAQL